jgi:site-specific recombinase XerD
VYHLHRYLLAEHQLLQVSQLTDIILRDWVAFLQQRPPPGSAPLAASTIETYARSVRAFCTWLVQQGTLPVSPMSREAFPRASIPLPVCVSSATFEQFMHASFPPEAKGSHVRRQAACDRALLWVLFETGITVSELCALRVGDLDQDAGLLAVRGEQGKERQLALGPSCQAHLFAFVEQAHAMSTTNDDPLFRAESGLPLTKNRLTLLFRRLRAGVGISKTPITPQSLRHSFALRYLQVGGSPRGLRELLGYEGMTQVKQYLRWHEQLVGAHAESRPDLVER